MAELLLKTIIYRMKRKDILTAIMRWSLYPAAEKEKLNDLLQSQQKLVSAAQIADICCTQRKFTIEKVGDLDLIYSSKSPDYGSNPQKFHDRLKKSLMLYFTKDCCLSTMLYNGLLWGRVYIPKPSVRRHQASQCLYFIHYPGTPVIMFSGTKATYTQFLSQCLLVTLGYKRLNELNLTGRHYESLAELTFNKYSKGGLTKFQTNGNVSRKRKAPEFEADERIQGENAEAKRRRLDLLEEKFGPNVQPILERLEYRVELPYRSREVVPELRASDQLFNSRVTFQGTNVLEGIRNLAEKGYATVPLPKHLTCVPSRPRNYFVLAKQQRTATSKSQTATQSQSVNTTQSRGVSRPMDESRNLSVSQTMHRQEAHNRSLRSDKK